MVVGEGEDETVELVGGHEVQMLLNLLDGKEMAADIEVASAPGKARIVEDGAFLEGNAAVGGVEDVDREHLHEGLEGVEKTRLGVGTDEDALRLTLDEAESRIFALAAAVAGQ